MVKNILSFVMIALMLCGCSSGGYSPQAGSSLSGKINIEDTIARAGDIYINISEDGTKIKDITLRLMNVMCNGRTTGIVNFNVVINFPISGKQFTIDNEYFGTINGIFSTQTQVNGTIHIILKKNIANVPEDCDLGTFKWSATVN